MKKYLILFVLLAFAGVTLNCNTRPVPPNSFRVKTRGKVHLFGIPLPLSIPNPNIAVNLKTSTTAGTAGTTGTIAEFNPGGAFVSTDGGGIFDAVNAVLPAVWNARIAPNQSRCSAPVSNPFAFTASNGSTHKLNCKWNVIATFLIEPGQVAVGVGEHLEDFIPASSLTPANSLTGIMVSGGGGFKRLSAQQLKVEYYRNVSGEDYVLDGEKPVTSVALGGSSIVVPVPTYVSNQGIHHYRILIKEDNGVDEIYVAHGEMDVSYPVRRNCPGTGRTCNGEN